MAQDRPGKRGKLPNSLLVPTLVRLAVGIGT